MFNQEMLDTYIPRLYMVRGKIFDDGSVGYDIIKKGNIIVDYVADYEEACRVCSYYEQKDAKFGYKNIGLI